jgi:hypothetical protein
MPTFHELDRARRHALSCKAQDAMARMIGLRSSSQSAPTLEFGELVASAAPITPARSAKRRWTRQQVRGLRWHGSEWYIDTSMGGHKVKMSTGTSDLEQAKRILADKRAAAPMSSRAIRSLLALPRCKQAPQSEAAAEVQAIAAEIEKGSSLVAEAERRRLNPFSVMMALLRLRPAALMQQLARHVPSTREI